jgi:type IV pilus assembly protein PilM
VGLDIEPGHVVAAETSVNGSVAIERAVVAPLAAEIVRDGEVTDTEALAETLRAMFREHKLNRRVRLGLANQRIALRTLELPRIDDAKDLDAAVRFQAQEQVPMPVDQAVLDFHPLGNVQTPDGERTRVALVAARRDVVERLLAATRGAGLRPVGIDLSAFAMIRALDAGAPGSEDEVLYVNVAGLTNIAIAAGTVCKFTRVVTGGMQGMVAALAERRGLTVEHSEQWLTHVGLSEPVESIDGDPEIVTEARSVLADSARRIADEMRSTLDFHRSQDADSEVSRAVLTGGAVAIPGFADQLSADLGMTVEPRVVREAQPGALAGVEAGQLTVAAGLTVEERP